MPIRSFKDRETKKIFGRQFSKKLPQSIQRIARARLVQLYAATTLADLSGPGLQLEKLARDRAGQHSIRINRQWRVCFAWKDGDAFDVEIIDYH